MRPPHEPVIPNPEAGRLRLGEWEVRRDEGVLTSGERAVRLEPRVMDVLVHLAANPGRVVSKEELLETVWSGAFVEEGALSQAVHSLRKALEDDARQPRYVQTVPKRGYRLVAPVELIPPPPAPAELPAPVAPLPSPRLPTRAGAPRNWVWLLIALAGLATVLGLVLLGRPPAGATPPPVPEAGKRIVVLPFEDLGPSLSPFFADGLTEEVKKDLGSLPFLQVIYRQISTQEKGANTPLAVGRAVRADYVLTGTVQWEPRPGGRPRVCIRPQLVRVVDGVQVWADSFEREIEDVFEVQSEISKRVISSPDLQSRGHALLEEQRIALRPPPARNLDAHQAYIRGLSLKDQPFYSEDSLRKAALAFERAVELDPSFAAAWAELSQVHCYLAYNTDPTPARVEQARQALDRATALAPYLPEVRLARAYFAYRCREDFDGALAQVEKAVRLFPNDAEVFKARGLLLRRKGRLKEAIEALQQAKWLDPRTGEIVWILPETYRALRHFQQADSGFARAIAQAPDVSFFWEQKVLNQLAETGDPKAARALLEKSGLAGDPTIETTAFRLDLYEGELAKALSRITPELLRQLPPEIRARILMVAAVVRDRMGDHRGALAAAEANRADLEAKIARYPSRGFLHASLAVALAQLGQTAEALAEAGQAAHMRQTDAFSGPRIGEIQALVDVILGRHREAIDRLARQLAIPYRGSLTKTDLRLDPVWQPLRGEPAFEALLR